MTKPRPEEYETRARYRWALKQWHKTHGGGFFSIIGTLSIAAFFGALTGSVALFFLLIAFAIVATMVARGKD